MIDMVLWTLLCFTMWFWAIVGTVNVVLGALSFFFDLSSVFDIGPKPVSAMEQQAHFLSLSASAATVGITFLWLRRRGHLKFFPEE
jgi:hypothetical protein